MKMYNYIPMIFLFAIVVLLLTSCEQKEVMEYEGVDGIYFDVQWGPSHFDESRLARQHYTYVSFGSIEAEEAEITMKVGISGSIKDYDRPFRVEIVADSTNAIPEEEYTGFTEEQVIKAGENRTYITFKVFKTPRQTEDTVRIQFRIDPGEYFTLPFSEVGKVPGRENAEKQFATSEDPAVHNVFYNNILSRPAGWGANEYSTYFGTFSPDKYQYLMDVSGYTKAHFEQLSAMTQGGRGTKIRSIAIKDLQARFNKGYYRLQAGDADGWEEWMLERNGKMMWVPGITWWNEDTLPDELVKQYYKPQAKE